MLTHRLCFAACLRLGSSKTQAAPSNSAERGIGQAFRHLARCAGDGPRQRALCPRDAWCGVAPATEVYLCNAAAPHRPTPKLVQLRAVPFATLAPQFLFPCPCSADRARQNQTTPETPHASASCRYAMSQLLLHLCCDAVPTMKHSKLSNSCSTAFHPHDM